MVKRFYAGIGSRSTPNDVLAKMTQVASELEDLGFILRSGGAAGADFAFACGVHNSANKEIMLPRDATSAARELASHFHPVWPSLSDYVKNLHGRNSQIILGRDLDQPSEFVLCWTPIPVLRGGTKMGIDIARDRHIPIFNFFSTEEEEHWNGFLTRLKEKNA
jgi:hypothetical protein